MLTEPAPSFVEELKKLHPILALLIGRRPLFLKLKT